MLLGLKFLPRWAIFLLDLACVLLALSLSYGLRFNFRLPETERYDATLIMGSALLINSCIFIYFRSYRGIIRHTSLEDASRFLVMNTLVTLLYLTLNLSILRLTSQSQFPLSVILINFFTINFFLIGYRLLVKGVFRLYARQHLLQHAVKIRAAVYDTREQGLLVKRVISENPKSNMEVVAFIDDEASMANKALEGLPIYSRNTAGLRRLRHLGVELVIIADRQIAPAHLNLLVDLCLQEGIHVQQVPPVQQWINGHLKPDQLRDIRIEDLLERDVILIDNGQVASTYSGKKILVTGAAGSSGSELIRQLIRFEPALIILCDKAETPMHQLGLELAESFPGAPVLACMGDICDRTRMQRIFETHNPDVVFHAAAYKHVPLMEENPSLAVLNNILGTRNLVELSVAHGTEKFVMVSTDKAVNPTNIMGASKRIAEIFAQSYFRHLQESYAGSGSIQPTRFVTTRFGNVLGSNGSVIPRFKEQLEKGGPITVTHPDITRYFMTIPEACQLVLEAGAMGQGGEIFVFDMGKPVKIADLARKMICLAGKEPDVDIQITFTGLRPGEKLYEELLNNAENTIPTYHEKILIAQVREYDFPEVCSQIDLLIESARAHHIMETVRRMKEIVPEFISKNSVYEQLDAKAI